MGAFLIVLEPAERIVLSEIAGALGSCHIGMSFEPASS
jgi:hypothetical protein